MVTIPFAIPISAVPTPHTSTAVVGERGSATGHADRSSGEDLGGQGVHENRSSARVAHPTILDYCDFRLLWSGKRVGKSDILFTFLFLSDFS